MMTSTTRHEGATHEKAQMAAQQRIAVMQCKGWAVERVTNLRSGVILVDFIKLEDDR